MCQIFLYRGVKDYFIWGANFFFYLGHKISLFRCQFFFFTCTIIIFHKILKFNKIQFKFDSVTEYFRFLDDDFPIENFDEFIAKVFPVINVRFDEKTLKLSTCSCGSSQKNYICRHEIDIAVKKNMADYPLNAKNIPIGQKRKD